MKKFIYKTVAFVLPFWLLLTVVDYLFSQVAKETNDYAFAIESWHDVMNGDVEADVVVMGSSRALYHMNPVVMDSILGESTYNLGVDGRNLNTQINKYYIYRKRNKKPRLIIQNIDAFALKYEVGYNKYQFFPYFWDEDMRKAYFNEEPFTAGEKYLPMYRYIHRGLWVFLSNNEKHLVKGFRGQNSSWNGSAFERIDSIPFVVSDTTSRRFDEYLSQVKADGIKVVFVYSPIYIGATRKMTDQKRMYATYQHYADKYDIPILDYTNMWLCYDTSYFYNAMHLNKQGADIFSDSLAHDIKRLGILNKP